MVNANLSGRLASLKRGTQMPLLKDPPNLGSGMGTGGWLPQSSSIVRHIAKMNHLAGDAEDAAQQARIDFGPGPPGAVERP